MAVRKLLWGGVAGPMLFTLVWLVEGALRPDYSPARHWISELSLTGRGWIQIASFLVTGALIAGFARGVRSTFTEGPAATWGPRLLAASGVALMASGVFVIDPGASYPPDAAASVTWHGVLHDLTGPVVIFTLAGAALVYSRRVARGYARASGVGTVVFWLAAGVLSGLDNAGVWSPAPAGLLQRVAIVTGFAWLVSLSVHALRATRSVPGPALSAEAGGG